MQEWFALTPFYLNLDGISIANKIKDQSFKNQTSFGTCLSATILGTCHATTTQPHTTRCIKFICPLPTTVPPFFYLVSPGWRDSIIANMKRYGDLSYAEWEELAKNKDKLHEKIDEILVYRWIWRRWLVTDDWINDQCFTYYKGI